MQKAGRSCASRNAVRPKDEEAVAIAQTAAPAAAVWATRQRHRLQTARRRGASGYDVRPENKKTAAGAPAAAPGKREAARPRREAATARRQRCRLQAARRICAAGHVVRPKDEKAAAAAQAAAPAAAAANRRVQASFRQTANGQARFEAGSVRPEYEGVIQGRGQPGSREEGVCCQGAKARGQVQGQSGGAPTH